MCKANRPTRITLKYCDALVAWQLETAAQPPFAKFVGSNPSTASPSLLRLRFAGRKASLASPPRWGERVRKLRCFSRDLSPLEGEKARLRPGRALVAAREGYCPVHPTPKKKLAAIALPC